MKLKKYVLIIMTLFMINIGTTYALDTNNFAIIAATTTEECDSIFSSELMDLLRDIIGYVRIIVPILLIVLGSVDLAKAVFASKEDEIKKAQKTFVMRIVAGVLVFLVPVIVNIVLWLAEKAGVNGGCRF